MITISPPISLHTDTKTHNFPFVFSTETHIHFPSTLIIMDTTKDVSPVHTGEGSANGVDVDADALKENGNQVDHFQSKLNPQAEEWYPIANLEERSLFMTFSQDIQNYFTQ